jgi:hypothetical protein
MATRSKASTSAANAAAGIARAAFTRAEFCARWAISPSKYILLLKAGKAPQEVDVDGSPRITLEDEAVWAAALQAEQATTAA